MRPRAWVAGRPLVALRAVSAESERIETSSGPATRVRVCADAGSGLQLELSIEAAAGWPGIVIQLALHNTGASSAKLDALDALWWLDSRGELELPGAARELRWLDPGAHGSAPARDVALRGRLSAECAAQIAAAGKDGLALGFLGWREHLGEIAGIARGGALAELELRNPIGARLASGQRASGDRVWLGLGAAPGDGLAAWAERAGCERPGPTRPAISTWCMGTGASAQGAIELARALRERELPVDAIRLDSGFAERAGDWLGPTREFPAGLEPVAAELSRLGFDLALRISPFAAERRSELARVHPDWLHPGEVRGSGAGRAALDLAREPVVAWLEQLAQRLGAAGVRHLFLDELWLGLRPESERPAAVYRRALEALRHGIGPEAFLAGLAAPFAASLGLLDALEIEPEPGAPRRRRWWQRRESAGHALELRAAFAGRLAHALTASVRLDTPESAARRRAAIASALCGSACFCGEPERVTDAGWRLARRLLPPGALKPIAWPGEPSTLVASAEDGALLAARLAPENALDLGWAFGADRVRVFDAWSGRERPSVSGSLAAGASDAGPELLRLTRADGRPRLIGSSLHLSAGAVELTRCEALPGSGLALELALPGPREGSIQLQPNGSGPGSLRLRVGFSDRLELCVDSAFVADAD